MIKAILVDDEKMALEGLMLKIKKQFSGIEIMKTFQSPEKAVAFINKNQPDILFLDI